MPTPRYGTATPNSAYPTDLSRSDKEKLSKIFPGVPYLNGYDDVAFYQTADAKLHPLVQQGVLGWSDDTNLNFADPDVPNQLSLGTDEVPLHGYAAYPNPDSKEVQPRDPVGFDPNNVSDNLAHPSETGPTVFHPVGVIPPKGTHVASPQV